jgi:acid phosphatase
VRRERPHPGAQLSLFDTVEGMRHQVMATDTPPGNGSIQYLEARHRAHARVEDRIRTGHPDPLFQYHHQPFNYFQNYAPGVPGRTHLKDEKYYLAAAKAGTLPAVSFVKPIGAENEHPGYASTDNGESHLVDLLKATLDGPAGKDTLVVVTYDEFGGQWDHVAPPGQGQHAAHGPADQFGPGTRIPALVIGGGFDRSGVDHQPHDTTSILATIERAYGLTPLSSRDAHVTDLRHTLLVGGDHGKDR